MLVLLQIVPLSLRTKIKHELLMSINLHEVGWKIHFPALCNEKLNSVIASFELLSSACFRVCKPNMSNNLAA